MGSRAGLQKVVKSVRGKKGTVRRTYWIKTKDAVKGAGRFLNKHKGKIAGAALLAGAAYLGNKHRGAIGGALSGARKGVNVMRTLGDMHKALGGSGANARDYAAGAKTGAVLGGLRGHMKDTDRHAANATARQQAGNRLRFVASGLRQAAGTAATGLIKNAAMAVTQAKGRLRGAGAIEPARSRGLTVHNGPIPTGVPASAQSAPKAKSRKRR